MRKIIQKAEEHIPSSDALKGPTGKMLYCHYRRKVF